MRVYTCRHQTRVSPRISSHVIAAEYIRGPTYISLMKRDVIDIYDIIGTAMFLFLSCLNGSEKPWMIHVRWTWIIQDVLHIDTHAHSRFYCIYVYSQNQQCAYNTVYDELRVHDKVALFFQRLSRSWSKRGLKRTSRQWRKNKSGRWRSMSPLSLNEGKGLGSKYARLRL